MTPILIRALCLIEHKHEVFLLRKHEKGKLRVMLKAVMNSLNCFDVSEEALISKDINRQLKKDGKVHNFNKHIQISTLSNILILQKQQRFANVLLLGTGEAGKSTFVKQMKLIHGGGFTDEDKTRFREDLVTNVTDSVVTLSREMMKLGIAYKVQLFLAPTGAQEVTMSICVCVCPSVIFLNPSSSCNLYAVSEQSLNSLLAILQSLSSHTGCPKKNCD